MNSREDENLEVPMRLYRKKPHKVRAFKITEENFDDVCAMKGFSRVSSISVWVPTFMDADLAKIGDWVVGHPDFNSYPYFIAMDEDEFNIRYEDDEGGIFENSS